MTRFVEASSPPGFLIIQPHLAYSVWLWAHFIGTWSSQRLLWRESLNWHLSVSCSFFFFEYHITGQKVKGTGEIKAPNRRHERDESCLKNIWRVSLRWRIRLNLSIVLKSKIRTHGWKAEETDIGSELGKSWGALQKWNGFFCKVMSSLLLEMCW